MQELADQLRSEWEKAAHGDKVVTIHLFGIKNAARLNGRNLHELAERAGFGRSFGTELRKGGKACGTCVAEDLKLIPSIP